jgi:Tfp pilus assembly protein PilF
MKRGNKSRAKAIQPDERISYWHVLVLVVLCFAGYANSLNGEFVWDDKFQVVRNETIRTLANIPKAFTSSLWAFMYSEGGAAAATFNRYYRPLQTVTYIFTYKAAGLSPLTFHLVNVTLHSAVTVLVYIFCLRIGFYRLTALLAAGLFAVQPVHTEAVTFIAGTGDLLCALFYLSGLIAVLQYFRIHKPAYLWAAAGCFLAALFSKEVAITFPLTVAILQMRYRPSERNVKAVARTMIPFAVVFALYFVLRLIAIGSNLPGVIQEQASMLDWATLVAWVTGNYIRYALVPYPLAAQHSVPLHLGDRVGSTLVFGAILVMTAALLWYLRKKISLGPVLFAIFVTTLAPVLYFQGSGILFAERYLYLPSVPLIILIVTLIVHGHQKAGSIAVCCLIALFIFLTAVRNRDWVNDEVLYRRTLQVEPGSAKFWNNLGLLYLEKGDTRQAQECFAQAWQHADDKRFIQDIYEKYRVNLGRGIIAARAGQNSEARLYLNSALQFDPDGDGAYTTLAGLAINDRDYPGASDLLNKTLQLNPKSELARDYLGVVLLNQGKYEQAVSSFTEALRLNPDFDPAKQHLEFVRQNLKLNNN